MFINIRFPIVHIWIPVIFRSCCKLTQFTFRFDVYCRRFQLQFIMGKLLKCKLLFHAALIAGSIANFKYKINKSSKMFLNVIKSLSWFNAQLSISFIIHTLWWHSLNKGERNRFFNKLLEFIYIITCTTWQYKSVRN